VILIFDIDRVDKLEIISRVDNDFGAAKTSFKLDFRNLQSLIL